MYVAITLDIKKSKTLDASEKNDLLLRRLKELNNELGPHLLKPFKYLNGDEVQSLLEYEHIDKIFLIIRTIKYYFGEVKYRLGIGIGDLDDKSKEILEESEYSQMLDGTCFHAARNAFDKLNMVTDPLNGYNTYFVLANRHNLDMVNDFTRFIDVTTDQWKKHHFEIVRQLEANKGLTYEEAGKKINKNKFQISRNLKTCKWELVKKCELHLIKLLVEAFENGR